MSIFEPEDLKAIAIIMIGVITLSAVLMREIDSALLGLALSIIAGLAGYQVGIYRARKVMKCENK